MPPRRIRCRLEACCNGPAFFPLVLVKERREKGIVIFIYGGSMETISTVGIDLSKNVFQICMTNHAGRTVRERKVRRENLLGVVNQLPEGCQVFMETCQGSHYWTRKFNKLGLQAKQIPAQYVKPFVKSQKNDREDAKAICEAGSRPNMRFVPEKTVGQLELQQFHRIRERLMRDRTGLINQTRGVLAENGIVVNKGVAPLKRYFQHAFDKELELSCTTRTIVNSLKAELTEVETRIDSWDKQIAQRAAECPVIKRLMSIPGIGVLGASALTTVSGNVKEFKNGRQFAAFLGLVPRQVSTGGKPKLLGITKHGNTYLRTLLIHGARSVVRYAIDKKDPYSLWIRKLHAKNGTNHTAVALANKNARIAWRILTSHDVFDQKLAASIQ